MDLAALHPQIEAVERRHAAEALDEPVRLDDQI